MKETRAEGGAGFSRVHRLAGVAAWAGLCALLGATLWPAVRLLPEPYPFDYMEGPMLHVLAQLRAGHLMPYRAPDVFPLFWLPYMPLYFYAAAGAAALARVHDVAGILLAGRGVVLASFLGLLAAGGVAIRRVARELRVEHPALVPVCLALFLLLPPLLRTALILKPEMPALAWAWLGIVLGARGLPVGAACCGVIALWTKQVMFLPPAAAVLWYLSGRHRLGRAWRRPVVVFLALNLFLMAFFALASRGVFFRHVGAPFRDAPSAGNLLRLLTENGGFVALAALISAAFAWSTRAGQRPQPFLDYLRIYLALVWVTLPVQLARSGSNHYVFLELAALLPVLSPALCAGRRPAWRLAGLLLLLAAAGWLQARPFWTARLRLAPVARRGVAETTAFFRDRTAQPVVPCEEMFPALLAGREPWQYTQWWFFPRGPRRAQKLQELIARLEDQRPAYVLLGPRLAEYPELRDYFWSRYLPVRKVILPDDVWGVEHVIGQRVAARPAATEGMPGGHE